MGFSESLREHRRGSHNQFCLFFVFDALSIWELCYLVVGAGATLNLIRTIIPRRRRFGSGLGRWNEPRLSTLGHGHAANVGRVPRGIAIIP